MRKCWVIILLFLPNLVHAQIITTVTGNGMPGYNGDGILATTAKINNVPRIAVDKCGNIYLGDGANHRVRKVDALTGIITTIAGTGVAGYNGDGIPATSAQLNFPTCIVLDSYGNIFFGDANNNRVRRVDRLTGIITTYVGNGALGFSGDGGPATAALINCGDFAIDTADNMYMCDFRRTRRIDANTGIITTIAGNGMPGPTISGGPATATCVHNYPAIATDISGNVYTVDSVGTILKIEISSGILKKVAGSGTAVIPYSGDGTPATSCNMNPAGIFVDDTGNIYAALVGSHICIKIDTFGYTHTIAGIGTSGYSGDGGAATLAKLWYPKNIKMDRFGQIYIADWSNNRIRKITYPYTPTSLSISISGVPSATLGTSVTITASIAGAVGSSYLIRWMNHGIEFSTTTVPYVNYMKPSGIDTITARVVTTGFQGCDDSVQSLQHIVNVSSVGISSFTSDDIAIFPNPANESLTISSTDKMNKITITNLIGQSIIKKECNSETVQVDISPLPVGVYLIRINDYYFTKFVKQ